MTEPEERTRRLGWRLSLRQRRLRVITGALLVAIAAMIAVGMTHPFFRITRPRTMTRAIRRALAVQGMMILGWWTVCFILAFALFLVAWLDIREIRRSLAAARRDFWLESARERRRESRGGDGSRASG